MSVYVTYLEDVQGLRFSISYIEARGPQHPDTQAEVSLLKANIAAMGLTIEPYLATSSSSPGNLTICSYSSGELSFLVKAASFTAIEEVKNGVLKGFNQQCSESFPKHMEYAFSDEYSRFGNENEEKLVNYFQKSSRDKIDPEVSKAVLSLFFKSEPTNSSPVKAEPQPKQGRSCAIL